MTVNLTKIRNAISLIDGEDWDGETVNYILDAIDSLKKLNESLENVKVKGRSNLDALLGCMMGLDMIIGEEDENG